jgi:hypothetical protein
MKMATFQAYLYGAGAPAAAGDQGKWQDWLARLFPAPEAQAAAQH